MKAILHQPGQPDAPLSIGEVPDPICQPHEVLIYVAATSLNRADLLQRRGQYPPPPGVSEILGLDVAGTVIEVGSEVEGFAVGDNVCALLAGGGYGQIAAADAAMVLKLPERLSFTKAAAIPEVFVTAYQALYKIASVKPGDHVLIHAGASGVGTAAIQLVLRAGAKPIVTASGHKHANLHQLGDVTCVDYRKEEFTEVVARITDNQGVNIVLDFVGAPYMRDNLAALAIDGHMVALGVLGGRYTENMDSLPIVTKRLTISGTTLRRRPADYKRALLADFRRDVWPAFADRSLRPLVDTIYDWEDVNEAFDYMESNANVGKIVVCIGE